MLPDARFLRHNTERRADGRDGVGAGANGDARGRVALARREMSKQWKPPLSWLDSTQMCDEVCRVYVRQRRGRPPRGSG